MKLAFPLMKRHYLSMTTFDYLKLILSLAFKKDKIISEI